MVLGMQLTDVCSVLCIYAVVVDAVGYGSPPNQQFVYTGKAPISPGIAEYDVDLTKLYQKTGKTKESAGRTCAELRSMGNTDSGLYWIKPDTYDFPYQTYCDMKSFGGGWQMCYTSQYSKVHLTDENELVYNASLPYKTDGYRSNCKNVPFNQILYVLHVEPKCLDRFNKRCKDTDPNADEDEKAYFTYETTEGESLVSFVIAGNSGRNLVTPAVQLMYTQLNEMKRRYAFEGRTPLNDRGDQQLPESQDRAAFSGSVPTNAEAEGLFENYARRLDIRGRATDFWRGRGVAYKVSDAGVVSTTDNWKYQLLICDERSPVPVGLFMSGIDADAAGCFKTCGDWCGDTVTDHYRASWAERFCNSTHADGSPASLCVGPVPDLEPSDIGPGRSVGSAFRQNGYPHTTFKPISVGIRYRVDTR